MRTAAVHGSTAVHVILMWHDPSLKFHPPPPLVKSLVERGVWKQQVLMLSGDVTIRKPGSGSDW